MTPEKALALFLDNKFTKEQYIDIQQTAKAHNAKHNANIYPTYNSLLEAKKRCYPKNITITEASGEVRLQSLVQHTIQRFATVQKDVFREYFEIYNPTKRKVIFKWGCDGASGQSRYMQGFEDINGDDGSLLFSVDDSPKNGKNWK